MPDLEAQLRERIKSYYTPEGRKRAMELVLGMGTLPLKRLPKSQEFADWDAAVDIFRGKRAGSLEDVIAAINTIRAEARRQLTPRELRKKWPLDKIIDVIQKRIRAEEY